MLLASPLEITRIWRKIFSWHYHPTWIIFNGYVVQFQAYQPCAWTKPLGGPREAMVEWVNRRHEGNLAWTLRKNWRPHSETVASRVFAHAFGRSADTECMPSVFPWGNYGSKWTVKLKNLASMRKNCWCGPNPAEDEGWGLMGKRSGSGADAIDSHQ